MFEDISSWYGATFPGQVRLEVWEFAILIVWAALEKKPAMAAILFFFMLVWYDSGGAGV